VLQPCFVDTGTLFMYLPAKLCKYEGTAGWL
jgi:hypothetical protein